MIYVGKLYGKIDKKVFDTGKTSDQWDAMEQALKDIANTEGKRWLQPFEMRDIAAKALNKLNGSQSESPIKEKEPLSGPHICEYCDCQCTCMYDPCIHCEDASDDPYQCDICGLTDDHYIECPKSNNPFSNLINEGFD